MEALNQFGPIIGVATEVECKLYVRSLGSINPDTMVNTAHYLLTILH